MTELFTGRLEPDGLVWILDGRYIISANEGDLGSDEYGDGVRSGGRNIMIWDLEGNLVYDSGPLIDAAVAAAGLYVDGRSPERGSEPEGLSVSRFGSQEIAAVAAERAGAILSFDTTDVQSVVLLNVEPAGEGPEQVIRIPGRPLLVSAGEKSGTLTFFGPTGGCPPAPAQR